MTGSQRLRSGWIWLLLRTKFSVVYKSTRMDRLSRYPIIPSRKDYSKESSILLCNVTSLGSVEVLRAFLASLSRSWFLYSSHLRRDGIEIEWAADSWLSLDIQGASSREYRMLHKGVRFASSPLRPWPFWTRYGMGSSRNHFLITTNLHSSNHIIMAGNTTAGTTTSHPNSYELRTSYKILPYRDSPKWVGQKRVYDGTRLYSIILNISSGHKY